MFTSKFPIISLGMNKVSDLSLALAVSEADAIPTISGFNYVDEHLNLNLKELNLHFSIYKNRRDKCDFIFSINDKLLVNNIEIIDLVLKYNIPYLEIIMDNGFNKSVIKSIEVLRNNNIKLLTKLISLDISDITLINFNKFFDGFIIKGSEGAGRIVENNKPIQELLLESLNLFPNKHIIPSGGIGTPEQVKELIELGATAVGIGTLFAASTESSIAYTAKEKIINSNFNNITQLDTIDYKQNALVFSKINQSKVNNTRGLVMGVITGEEGHVFAGKSINYITEIKTVKEIVNYLCKNL
jgi:enoyl-[acyl-carrier protein] reductase II